MIAQFPTAHKTIPSVEVLIQEQMLCAAVRTLGYAPEKKPVSKCEQYKGQSRQRHSWVAPVCRISNQSHPQGHWTCPTY